MAFELGNLLQIVDKDESPAGTNAPRGSRSDGTALATSSHAQGDVESPITKPARSVCHDRQDETAISSASHLSPGELECSRPPTPKALEAAGVRERWNNPKINIARMIAACTIQLANGMNDSAPGALLPYIEEHYNVNYIVVSMIWICNAAGFIAAAFWVHALDRRLGRAKTLMLNEGLCAVGCTILAVVPPFPVFAIMYFLVGVGQATNLALNNVYVANFADSNKPLGSFHGCYGLGGLLAPIFATTMVSNGIVFQRFYLIMLGLRIVTFCSCGMAFWNLRTQDEEPKKATHETSFGMSTTSHAPVDRAAIAPWEQHDPVEPPARQSSWDNLKQSLRNKITPFGALFIFAYQGAEVTISGWVISFLITTRGGDPAHVGYVTAGFWGGITFGRFVINPLGPKLGERWFAYALICGTAAFQFVVWFAPNVIADGVATAMLGVLLGPIYPCATTVFTRLLPRKVQNSSLAFISSAGSSGGALAPFITGIIAQSKGTYVLHPICVALYAVMLGCWLVLTKGYEKKRHD